MQQVYSLGIDLGSISLKVVLLDRERRVAFDRWTRVAGAPLDELDRVLNELRAEKPDAIITGVGVTGSGKGLIAASLGAVAVNEITAHANAAAQLFPQVRTIIEIGGQDSKLVVLADDDHPTAVKDFRMNELCAAGTGAFLDQQASRLGLDIDAFARLADDATDPASIAGRCAVFAKSDMTHHQQEGRSLADIVAGLNEALVRSYLANLVRGRDLPRPIAFQGGVACNCGLVDAFRRLLACSDDDLIVPEQHRVMGAIGAAIVAAGGAGQAERQIDGIIDAFEYVRERSGSSHLDEDRRARLEQPTGEILEPDFDSVDLDDMYLGVDVGSVSVKLAAVGPTGIAYEDYRFSDGRPLETLRAMVDDMQRANTSLKFMGIGVTGSGRHFIGTLLGADAVINEISAQVRAVHKLFPAIDTVVEIGGQDAKFMRIADARASYFSMNKVCAAGTGAFLQEQAKRLHIDLERDFAPMAFKSTHPVNLGARCTVFMESDLVSHQQQGFRKGDLVAGLAGSVVTNYVEKVVAGHPLGDNVLFLGGVAQNRAVVAAMEAKLKRPMATSTISKLTGAVGAALAAVDEVGRMHGSRTARVCTSRGLDFERFTCTDCPNSCRVIRTRDEPVRYFGGTCGKWDAKPRRHDPDGISFLKARARLMEGEGCSIPDVPAERGAPRIGIPRALMAFDRLPVWKTFFAELGCEVVVSPPTQAELLTEGMKHLVIETCLPVKAFCAHLHWLDVHGKVDHIFVLPTVSTGEDRHGNKTIQCPYIQGLAQIARPVAKTPLIAPAISWTWHPKDEQRALRKVARDLGFATDAFDRAWERACEVERAVRERLRAMGARVLDDLGTGLIGRAFVLLGKDYNVNDTALNAGVVQLLEARGETVITQDMLVGDEGAYPHEFRSMYWSHGKEMFAAAHLASRTAGLVPIMITSFGCGPDSFTVRAARELTGDTPMLVLDVDEHSSSVGVETRVEAFLDSLPPRDVKSSRNMRPRVAKPSEITRVFLPNFSDHGYAFAAAVRALGLDPVLTDLPNDESARFGAAHATHGECHPFILMLGDYIKTLESGQDFKGACYFMPESTACRLGQFSSQMRLLTAKYGTSLPIVSYVSELAPFTRNTSFTAGVRALATYWEMMRGMDFLMQKHLETRAYEVQSGAADRAQASGRKRLMASILEGKPLKGLEQALGLLKAVPVDLRRRRVKIGITGDYYTRVCDYANGHIFREIERLGGVIMLPPTMSDFAKYDAYRKRTEAVYHRKPKDLVKAMIVRGFIERRERRVRKIFGDDLMYDVPLDYKRSMEMVGPYMDFKLPPALTGSVAAIMEQMSAGAHGILSIITFHCNYGLVVNSVLATLDKDYPHIPKLPLIFEGLKPTHNVTRLEAFMEQVHAGVDAVQA